MYIARRELQVAQAPGKLITIKKGEEVPGFEKWDEVPRRAHINMGWVEKVADLPVQKKRENETEIEL